MVDLDTQTKRPADVVVDLTARQGKVRIASGKTVEGYSLNDRSPGPLIEATVGQLVEVRLHNESVKGGVALHWHGVDVPNAQDGVAGVTQDAVGVGEDHTYRWVAPDAGSYWYHSHQLSNEQVTGGLFGGIIVHPKAARERGSGRLRAVAPLRRRPHDRRTHGLSALSWPGRDSGCGCGWSTPTTASRTPGRRRPSWCARSTGSTSREPTEVGDRSSCIPAGGRADLEVRVPTDGTAVRVAMTGDVGLVIGPAGSKAASVEAAQGRARPPRLRLVRRRRLRHGRPGPEVRVLRRSPTGLPQRQAGPVVERQREALPGHADVRGQRGGRRTGPDLQPQRSEPPDAPARPSRGRAVAGRRQGHRQPVVVRLARGGER